MQLMLKLLVAASAALAAGFLVEGARADEAYVCEGGRVVTVKPGQLEALKQTDDCIAHYYPDARRKAQAEAQRAGAGEPAVKISVPATAQPATAPSDYRHVRLLNPQPGAPSVYFHRR